MHPRKQSVNPHVKQSETQIDFFEQKLEAKFLEKSILGYKTYLVGLQVDVDEIMN